MIKKTLTIILLLNLSLLADNTKEKIDLTKNSDIKVINEDIKIIEVKTKEDYEKESDLLNPEYKEQKEISSKKESDITIDGGVGFNKSDKTIDGVKLNLGTKF